MSDQNQIADELSKAFAEFKDANDARFAAIEKDGIADPLLLEKVDKANADVDRLSAALDETNRSVGRLKVGGSESGSDAIRDQAMRFVAARTGRPVAEVSDEQVQEYTNYTQAFNAHIRNGGARGELLSEGMRNALQVGSDPDGGLWVPSEISSTVATRLFETSDVRSIANVVTISTDSYDIPTDTNKGTSGGWAGETTAPSETGTPQVGMQKIVVHKQWAEPRATQQLLDDSVVNVEGWLAGKIADILMETENTSFVSGNGNSKPRGFLDYSSAAVTTADASRDWGILQYLASGASGGFPTVSGSTASDPDALLDLIAELKPAYLPGAVFAMSRRTQAAIRKLKDADGNYLVDRGVATGATGFTLFGHSIHTMEDMPALGSDTFSLAFGNFREGYTIVDRQGLQVLRDPYTSKPFVKFYTTKRVGGDVTNFDAIKLMKFAA